MSVSKILLSVILFGRNDNYQQHWVKRLEYCLNFNLIELEKANCSEVVEFHIVDHLSENKISDSIIVQKTFSDLYFHYIDREATNDERINPAFCMNTGALGGNGKFVLFMGVDQLFTSCHWEKMISFIKGGFLKKPANSFYLLIPRIQLQKGFPWHKLDVTELSEFFLRAPITSLGFRSLKKSVGGGAGAILIERDFFINHGMFETLGSSGYGGEDVELTGKARRGLAMIDALSLGLFCYKLPYSGGFRSQAVKLAQKRKHISTNQNYFYKYSENKVKAVSFCERYYLNLSIGEGNKTKISFLQHLKALKRMGFLVALHKGNIVGMVEKYFQFSHTIEEYDLINFVVDRDSMFAFATSLINGRSYYPVVIIANADFVTDVELHDVLRLLDQYGKCVEIKLIDSAEKIFDGGCRKLEEWSFKRGHYALTEDVTNSLMLRGFFTPTAIVGKPSEAFLSEEDCTIMQLVTVGSNNKNATFSLYFGMMVLYTFLMVWAYRIRLQAANISVVGALK